MVSLPPLLVLSLAEGSVAEGSKEHAQGHFIVLAQITPTFMVSVSNHQPSPLNGERTLISPPLRGGLS